MGQALQLRQAGISSRPLPASWRLGTVCSFQRKAVSYLGLSPANEVFALLLLQPQANRLGRKARETGWPGLGFAGLRSLLCYHCPSHLHQCVLFPDLPLFCIPRLLLLTGWPPFSQTLWAGVLKNRLTPNILVCPFAESDSPRHSLTFKSDLLLEAPPWGPPPPMFREAGLWRNLSAYPAQSTGLGYRGANKSLN